MLRIRLSRLGSTHRPFYRFVVSDSRKRPSSTAVDTLGFYDPTKKPTVLKLDVEKAEAWISKGAVPTERVQAFIKQLKKAQKTASPA
ncbi:MAG TPA: 30S ribosomal protein S16 [Patescibacteria group bacterium]|nr:30S ribosomal protein S16 [Patescibacteria group bacterium]